MVKCIAVLTISLMLSGCLGGTVAQQIARSIATSLADKAMAHAMDVDEDQAYSNHQSDYSNAQTSAASNQNPTAQSTSLMQPYRPVTTQPNNQDQINKDLAKQNLEKYNAVKRGLLAAQTDPYKVAIANTAFEEVKPEDIKPVVEPLPTQATDAVNPIEVIPSNQLVRVELFNLLIGKDKDAVYEQARLMGSISLPDKREWQHWQVATGAIKSNQSQPNKTQSDQKIITFLIPPEFGKLPSGAVTMVELASPGELNMARYKVN